MPRKPKEEQEAGYMRSLWDELRYLQVDHTGTVAVTCDPSERPGVFYFRFVFRPANKEDMELWGTQAIQIEFPNGSRQMLSAALWTALMKLTDAVVDARTFGPQRPKKDA